MFRKAITFLTIIFSKKICTKEQFMGACDKAKEYAEADEDGFISLKEAIYIVIRLIMNKEV